MICVLFWFMYVHILSQGPSSCTIDITSGTLFYKINVDWKFIFTKSNICPTSSYQALIWCVFLSPLPQVEMNRSNMALHFVYWRKIFITHRMTGHLIAFFPSCTEVAFFFSRVALCSEKLSRISNSLDSLIDSFSTCSYSIWFIKSDFIEKYHLQISQPKGCYCS